MFFFWVGQGEALTDSSECRSWVSSDLITPLSRWRGVGCFLLDKEKKGRRGWTARWWQSTVAVVVFIREGEEGDDVALRC